MFFFFGCRVWFSFEDGAATSSFVGSYCWCCALVGSEAQPTVAVTGAGVHLHVGLTWPPSGGGVHVHTLPRRVAAPPQVLRNLSVQLQWEGLRDGNLFVGASPVVDYFAFMLENLANSALHRVSGEPLWRCVLRPVDQASNEKQVVERFSCCNT